MQILPPDVEGGSHLLLGAEQQTDTRQRRHRRRTLRHQLQVGNYMNVPMEETAGMLI